jgi:lipid A 3-O-deacylase
MSMKRIGALAAMLSLGALPGPSEAAGALAPDAAFAQVGGGTPTQALTLGLQWTLPWQAAWAGGVVSSYVEASVGRWRTSDQGVPHTAWVTQLGLTPVLRYRFDGGDSPWFAEAGIGVNVLAPVFRDGDRQFSTAFNFGDHLALGRSFGAGGRQELSLRLQHFSNAGIKHPNPGINFVQLRYSVAF